MSNPLSVRRVCVQTIDEHGNPEGEPTYGVMASDSYHQEYDDTWPTLAALNQAIEAEGSIIGVLSEDWEDVDRTKVGTANFYGKDWMVNPPDRENEDGE